jgi:membrane-bound lytic murein transglycosylase A
MKKYYLTFLTTLTIATAVVLFRRQEESSKQIVKLDSLITNTQTLIADTNGKDAKNKSFSQLYTQANPDSLSFPATNARFISALENQIALIQNQMESKTFGDLKVSVTQLEKVVDIFHQAKSAKDLAASLQAFQLSGDDRQGNVRFTGYYSPVISVRRKSDGTYRYPVYIKAKKDEGLMTVYVKDKHDIYNMRIEGASFIQFPDGEKQLLSFDGQYQQLESTEKENTEDVADQITPASQDNVAPKKVLTSCTIFTPKASKSAPTGAGKTPLSSDYTVAVDTRFIPLGSVLLALVPVIDDAGNLIRHEYRFLLAQDTGSAIKGSGHLDLYCGEGEKGKRKAQFLHKYGKVWLLLPKKDGSIAQNL